MRNKILYSSLTISIALALNGCIQKYTPPEYTPPEYTPPKYTPPKYTPPPPKVFKNSKDTEAIKLILNKIGRNNINGNALMKQRGGGIVTCAGNQVALFPKTSYSTEYVEDIFSNGQYLYGYYRNGKGYKQTGNLVLQPYSNTSKTTTCDSQGNFEFQNLADGTYYVVTVVTWSVPSRYGSDTQGGNLIQEVELKNNSTKKIILSE